MIETIHSSHHHLGWSREQAPVRQVAPGDELELELLDASGNRVRRHDDASIVPCLKPENANPLTGPVAVEGAAPGDVLVVDILGFSHAGWGWTALIPGFGLLADQFPEPYLHVSEYSDDGIAFLPDVVLPMRPFAGTIGTCPDQAHELSAIPPHCCGGNMDYPGLTAGSRLYFPVQVPGALFSVGDGHAAQGDGEVCGTAVETRLSIRVRFSLLKEASIPSPKADIQLPQATGPALVTTGIGPDVQGAARDAVSFMIDELTARYDLSPEQAYCLCSCAADLGFAQLVNAPNWTLTCRMPLDCFK